MWAMTAPNPSTWREPAGQPDAAERNGAQPDGQRHQLHPIQRDKPGVITARVLLEPLSHTLVLQVEDWARALL